jgi:hypothetical protein
MNYVPDVKKQAPGTKPCCDSGVICDGYLAPKLAPTFLHSPAAVPSLEARPAAGHAHHISKCTASATIQLSQFPADQLRLVSSYLASQIKASKSEVKLFDAKKVPGGLLQANMQVSSACHQVEVYADRLNHLREHQSSLDHGVAQQILHTAGFKWHGTARIVSPIESSTSAGISKFATSRNADRRFPSVAPPDHHSVEASEDHSSNAHGASTVIFLVVCGAGYFAHRVITKADVEPADAGPSQSGVAENQEQGDAQEKDEVLTKYGGTDSGGGVIEGI